MTLKQWNPGSRPLLIRGLAASSLTMCLLLFGACGGGGGSSVARPTPTPVPTPTFTSTAPPDAAEGVDYTYELAATDPAGGTITFSLISSPPNASLNGSTLTWTPDHAHSRTTNSFQVRATSTNGGAAVQSFSVTPRGTVLGTSVNTFLTKTGEVEHPNPVGTYPPLIYIPDGEGYETIRGTGNDEDGSFSVAGVPAGPYLIVFPLKRIGDVVSYIVRSTSSDLDLGVETLGRPDCTPAPYSEETPLVTFNSALSDPTDLMGPITWYSGNVNSYDSQVSYDSITDPFQGQVFRQDCLLDSAQGDDAYAFLYEGLSENPAIRKIARIIGPLSITQTAGTTTAITAPFEEVTGDSTQIHPDIRVSQFDALLDQVAPAPDEVISVSRFNKFVIGAQPYVTHVSQAATRPSLLAYTDSGTEDLDLGDLSFINPLSGHTPYTYYSRVVSVDAHILETSTLQISGGLGVARKAMPATTAAIVPLLGPVRSPSIDGADLLAPRSTVSLTPTLSWQAPALGTPNFYDIRVYGTKPTPPGATITILRTAATSITLPAGIIEEGEKYIFVITAVQRAGSSDSAPFRDIGDYSWATTISAVQERPAAGIPMHAPNPEKLAPAMGYFVDRHSLDLPLPQ